MPDGLHASTFAPHVGTEFTVAASDGEQVALVLVEVTELPEQPGTPRPDPFNLVFAGPPAASAPQGLYELVHPILGRLELFLVPAQPEADGRPRYRASFN